MTAGEDVPPAILVGRLFAKFTGLGLLLGVLVLVVEVDPMGLLIGLSVIVLAVMASTLMSWVL